MSSRDPRTPDEWQEAVNTAALMRALHDCTLYGLIETNMRIDVERCDDILARGRARGVLAAPVDQLLESTVQHGQRLADEHRRLVSERRRSGRVGAARRAVQAIRTARRRGP